MNGGGKGLKFVLSVWAFLFVPLLLGPTVIRQTFIEFDRDEGVNFIKADLLDDHISLYDDIWADQPPLFPHLLSGVIHFFPQSIIAGRFLTLSLAGLLFWSLYQVVASRKGLGAGVVSVTVLAAFSQVLRYSPAVMIGIPCLAFGMLSVLAMNVAFSRRSQTSAFIAGAFGVFSVFTKFYGVVFSLPVIVLLLQNFYRERESFWRLLTAASAGGFSALAYCLALEPDILTLGRNQLFSSHLGARDIKVPHGWRKVRGLIRPDKDYVRFAAIGTIFRFYRRDSGVWQPLSLGLGSFLFLYLHRPVWNHHYPLLAVPLAWMCGETLADVYSWLKDFRARLSTAWLRTSCAIILYVGALLASAEVIRDIAGRVKRVSRVGYQLLPGVVTIINNRLNDGEYLFTDRPIYAFLAGEDVVARHAVITAKRLRTGDILQEDLLADISANPPQLILLDRFPKLRSNVIRVLGDQYSVIFEKGQTVLMERKTPQ